jgi:acetyl esterase/lipase
VNVTPFMLRSHFLRLSLAASAALSGCASSRQQKPPTGRVSMRKDVAFTPESWPERLVADLYFPEGGMPAPAVLLVHGGGWNGKESRSDMAGIANSLAKRGYFVMNTTYRLTPRWKFPAQTDDLEQALRFMRKNSGSLNIDPSRIATFGYSAGGHLAALIGLDPDNGIKAIVAGGAPADLSFWPDGRLTGLLLGGPLEGNEAIYREASPVTYVRKESPPTFIYHGTADDLVPIEHPKEFIAKLEQNGVEHEVYWINGRSHIFAHLFPASAISKAIDFLDGRV